METHYCEIMSNWEDEVGRVDVDLVVSNEVDVVKSAEGALASEKIRKSVVRAIVVSGATLLVLPQSAIDQLGVRMVREAQSRFADGRRAIRKVYGPIRLELQGRTALVEAVSGPEGIPALLGQVPLEILDLLIDSKNRKLIPNPESTDPNTALVDIF